MINSKINQVTSAITQILNNSGLPVGVGYLIVKDILNQLNEGYQYAITQEQNTVPQEHSDVIGIDDPNDIPTTNIETIEGAE